MGLDIEPDAVHASEHNAQLNGVDDRCTFYECEPVPPESPSAHSFCAEDNFFDVCVANIFQKDLINLRDSICSRVRPGGRIVMSGLLQHQVPRSSPLTDKACQASCRGPQRGMCDLVNMEFLTFAG